MDDIYRLLVLCSSFFLMKSKCHNFLLFIVFAAMFIVSGCSSRRTFYFIDENGAPVRDVLVVAEEFEMFCFFTDNRIQINKTDDKGRVVFYLDGSARCDGGKIGYYPVSFYSSGTLFFSMFVNPDPFKVLIRKDYGYGSLYYERDRVLLGEKEPKLVIDSCLWKDWELYLRWLLEQNYFEKDSPKKKYGDDRTFDMSGRPYEPN